VGRERAKRARPLLFCSRGVRLFSAGRKGENERSGDAVAIDCFTTAAVASVDVFFFVFFVVVVVTVNEERDARKQRRK
jgi:hypothetical protein